MTAATDSRREGSDSDRNQPFSIVRSATATFASGDAASLPTSNSSCDRASMHAFWTAGETLATLCEPPEPGAAG